MNKLKRHIGILVKGLFPTFCALCCFSVFFATSPVFALETYTNSIGMEFVQIPA